MAEATSSRYDKSLYLLVIFRAFAREDRTAKVCGTADAPKVYAGRAAAVYWRTVAQFLRQPFHLKLLRHEVGLGRHCGQSSWGGPRAGWLLRR